MPEIKDARLHQFFYVSCDIFESFYWFSLSNQVKNYSHIYTYKIILSNIVYLVVDLLIFIILVE